MSRSAACSRASARPKKKKSQAGAWRSRQKSPACKRDSPTPLPVSRERQAPVATRQGWSRRNEDAKTSGNLVSRPAGAIPARSRVSPPGPVASLAAGTPSPECCGSPLMRRHASEWAVGQAAPKRETSRMPRALERLKATVACTKWASAAPHPAGSSTTARTKRTAQAPGRTSVSSEGHRTSARTEVGRRQGTTRAEADEREGVGGLHMSNEVGERAAPGPGRAKAVRADVNFWREP